MNFLIIDTSSPQSFVALSKKGVLTVKLLPSPNQSQTLLPAIEKLLENQTLEFIAIGIGPGAFTGTRVGVMAAKALSFAKKIPLLPFCSLKIFTPEANGPFSIIGDAKSQGFYSLKGRKEGQLVTYEAPTLTPNGEVSNTLNLPLLASFLYDKFQRIGPTSHQDVAVSYLTTL